ncbi:neuropeptide-like 1 isoform X2 [Photinus pyralis]|uniref:Neuropeptide-like 1 n=1 Tax=Photinus pyralis TaxID=7054 RepID=A0A1Y1MTD6_PHOPY|nr:neuropeptide-like 1 isoform X2 [Photinus pyralis]
MRCPPKFLFCCGILWFLLFGEIKSEDTPISSCEIERLLKPILSPPEDRTIQAQALRMRLMNLIRQGLDEQVDNGLEEKGWDDMATKRSLQSLAREGYLRPSEESADDGDLKRSIQSLARMNQFPVQSDDLKRSISSLARNGELINNRREMEELLDEINAKRNIGSLARDFNFPSYGKRFLGSLARSGDLSRFESGKRNIASIVRNGKRNLPEGYDDYKRNIASLARGGGKFVGKRNVAALLRQDNYVNEQNRHDTDSTHSPDVEGEEATESKRNLPSIKAGYKPKFKRSTPYTGDYTLRSKRETDYYDGSNEEYLQPVYQNQNSREYDEILQALAEAYPNNDKRFLGRLPQMGKPKTTPSPKTRRINDFY